MKALILASEITLRPTSAVFSRSKQFVPIYNKSSLHYILDAVRDSGITEIAVVVGANEGDIREVVGDGSEWGLSATYLSEGARRGVVDAIETSEQYMGHEPFVVCTAAHLVLGELGRLVNDFLVNGDEARLLVARIPASERFGHAHLNDDGSVAGVHASEDVGHRVALLGAYAFTGSVFEAIRSVSATREEGVELDEVIDHMIAQGMTVRSQLVDGWWKAGGRLEDVTEAVVEPPAPAQVIDAREYTVGSYSILLPPGHVLDIHQAVYPKYDLPLSDIAGVVFEKYPQSTAIDVGANIGDSAAAIRARSDVPILCVEASGEFAPLLHENAKRLGGSIEVLQAYVGKDGYVVDEDSIVQTRSTMSPAKALTRNSEGGTATMSLESIVAKYPAFSGTKLVKIDTDGFDFTIITDAAEFLSRQRPVVFFEYDTENFGPEYAAQSLPAIAALLGAGYAKFAVYDCFGNFLRSSDDIGAFEELNAYLKSNRLGAEAAVRTWYLDVCAFHAEDTDVFDRLRLRELT